ncbi:MAG TPA: hypothetical protein VIU61_13550 [Kofleriaceae bacterium]
MALQYKFVEVSPVTDETLERVVNEWVAQNYALEGIRFVMTEASKRPAMAFVSFTREVPHGVADTDPPRKPKPLVAPEARTDDAGEPAVIVAHDEPG